jgi:hypothetical protein
MSEEQKRPLASFGVGPYSVSLWGNPVGNEDGVQRVMKSVSLRKGYFDKDENKMKHQSLSINPAEIGSVIALLGEMQNTVIEDRRQEQQREPF